MNLSNFSWKMEFTRVVNVNGTLLNTNGITMNLYKAFQLEVFTRSCGSPNFGNFGTSNLGVLGQNDIWEA
jgi:hypothetical protein